jgi:hypothetical protein
MHTPNCPAYFDGGLHLVPSRRVPSRRVPSPAPTSPARPAIEIVDGLVAPLLAITTASTKARKSLTLRITVELVAPDP